jgi:antitoxin VapB
MLMAGVREGRHGKHQRKAHQQRSSSAAWAFSCANDSHLWASYSKSVGVATASGFEQWPRKSARLSPSGGINVYLWSINVDAGGLMALQIANPAVVAKVERLAKATGLTKTAVVERAIDHLAAEARNAANPERMAALLAQLDRVPDRADACDPLQWDAQGLPK